MLPASALALRETTVMETFKSTGDCNSSTLSGNINDPTFRLLNAEQREHV
jgi:hypothetical protein